MRLCAASRPGEHPAVQQQRLAGLPGLHFVARQRVEVDAARARASAPRHLRPVLERRRLEHRGAGAVEHEVRVPRRGAVRDHRDRLRGRVRGVRPDLDVEHGGEAAEALRADAERVDLLVERDAQLLELVRRTALDQLVHVDRVHQRFLREQHGLLGRAAHADPEHARRAPARAHGRHGLEHPVLERVARVQHHELRLVLRAAALGGHGHLDLVARHQLDVEHRRRVVLGVPAGEERIVHDRGAQPVVRVVVGAAHALVDHLGEAALRVPAHVHADLEEQVDDAGVLADRPVALGAHARVGQDLRDRVLRRRRLLALVRPPEVLDVVDRVVVGDELQRVGDALDEIVLADHGHGATPQPPSLRLSSSFSCAGLALPWVAFITWPTKKPNSLSLPRAVLARAAAGSSPSPRRWPARSPRYR